jgi:hypothetical protein
MSFSLWTIQSEISMTATRQQAEAVSADSATGDLPIWDLSDLYQAMDDPAIERDLAAVDKGADALIKEGQGKLAEMDGAALAAFIAAAVFLGK